MYKCYADAMGNMPCDNGMLCDKCTYMDVEIINNYLFLDDWEIYDNEELEVIEELNEIFNL